VPILRSPFGRSAPASRHATLGCFSKKCFSASKDRIFARISFVINKSFSKIWQNLVQFGRFWFP
jgi:hypothetical protein